MTMTDLAPEDDEPAALEAPTPNPKPWAIAVDGDDTVHTLPLAVLREAGHHVAVTRPAPDKAPATTTSPAAAASSRRSAIDLMILAAMPGSGLPARIEALRKHTPLPVIAVLAHADLVDRVLALEAGADAVLDGPVDPRELRLRLEALIRRWSDESGGTASPAPVIDRHRLGDWRLNPTQRLLIHVDGTRIELSPAEWRLLAAFVAHLGRALARDQLMDLARGHGVDQSDRSIDLLVCRLRRKLRCGRSTDAMRIETVRGVGYRLVLPR